MNACIQSAAEVPDTTEAAPLTLSDAERQPCEVWTRVMGYHRPVASFTAARFLASRSSSHLGQKACSPSR